MSNKTFVAALVVIVLILVGLVLAPKLRSKESIPEGASTDPAQAAAGVAAALHRGTGQANQNATKGAMRTIATAQVGFQTAGLVDADDDGVGDYGTLAQLGNPPGGSVPFIDPGLASGQKHGYIFTVTVASGTATSLPAYTVTATPESGSGPCFFVDESGIIRSNPNGPADATSDML